MKLPAKIEYAYKAILELALRYDKNGPVQLSTMSESQGIPKKFLIQLLLRLKNANVVDSSRGVSGGYYLTRPPSQISLADVVRAVDESMIEAPKEFRGLKGSQSERLLSRIWSDITRNVAKRLEELTFDKFVSQLNKEQLTYQI